MSFVEEIQKRTNTARTANGGKAYRSSLDACLDFFALGAAKRFHPDDAVFLFEQAYKESNVIAVKILFYIRDVRGGCGERKIFRQCVTRLYDLSPEIFSKVLPFIPSYGRWDDLFAIPITSDTINLVKQQLIADLQTDTPSLMAKWLPSENTSSRTTRLKAKIIRERLGYSKKEYQKILSGLRSKLNLLENSMTFNKWETIDYSKLPGQAFRKHVGAFKKHDQKRFEEFLAQVASGEKTVNTDTLYCYEVFDLIRSGHEDAADIMWENLPAYTDKDALVVADVSGSMMGRPMDISVSLALYFAEMCQGPFRNKFITFSQKPQLVEITGDTLSEKLKNISTSDWGMNTNLQAVFDLILNSAVAAKAAQCEMPEIIYVISDMEFDACVYDSHSDNEYTFSRERTLVDKTVFEDAQSKFSEFGYKLPTVVFWNCNATGNHLPVTKFDGNVALVSGASQNSFKIAVQDKSPEEVMMETIGDVRYAALNSIFRI